jgi:hypothetical protein
MEGLPNEKRGCHRTGFTRKCRDLVVNGECERWVGMSGMDPRTLSPIPGRTYKCIDDWQHDLLIDVANLTREAGAAQESFRNEVCEPQTENQRERAALARYRRQRLFGLVNNNAVEILPPALHIENVESD